RRARPGRAAVSPGGAAPRPSRCGPCGFGDDGRWKQSRVPRGPPSRLKGPILRQIARPRWHNGWTNVTMAPDPTAPRSASRGGEMGEMLRILVVDESPRDRELIRALLRNAFGNVEVTEVADPADLESHVAGGRFDVVLADHRPSWVDAFHL